MACGVGVWRTSHPSSDHVRHHRVFHFDSVDLHRLAAPPQLRHLLAVDPGDQRNAAIRLSLEWEGEVLVRDFDVQLAHHAVEGGVGDPVGDQLAYHRA